MNKKQLLLFSSSYLPSSSTTDAVNVLDIPIVEFSSDYDGAFLTVDNMSQFATSYLWDFGDDAAINDTSVIMKENGHEVHLVYDQALFDFSW